MAHVSCCCGLIAVDVGMRAAVAGRGVGDAWIVDGTIVSVGRAPTVAAMFGVGVETGAVVRPWEGACVPEGLHAFPTTTIAVAKMARRSRSDLTGRGRGRG